MRASSLTDWSFLTSACDSGLAYVTVFEAACCCDAAGAAAYVNTEWHPDKIRARYDWIYQYDANSVGV